MWVQYLKWVARILQGDLGVSLDWRKPISELIGQRLLLTLALGLFTLLFTFAVAVPIGILSATRQYSFYDYFFTVFNYLGVATPTFMTALVLMWLAFSHYGITITGLFSPEYVDAPWSFARVVDLGKHIWLPIVILGLDGTARLARIMRANLLDELHKPYMEMARAKGMSEWRLVHEVPGAARDQPPGQQPRLVPAADLLGQPDRRDRAEPADHRPASSALADQPGHVPRRHHRA